AVKNVFQPRNVPLIRPGSSMPAEYIRDVLRQFSDPDWIELWLQKGDISIKL
ncbi:Hypothetical protein FKW44_005529, partial [Caligus rogercresseyi]